MKKIGPKGLRWVKCFHLLAVSCWVGGGVSLFLLYFLKSGLSDGSVLYNFI